MRREENTERGFSSASRSGGTFVPCLGDLELVLDDQHHGYQSVGVAVDDIARAALPVCREESLDDGFSSASRSSGWCVPCLGDLELVQDDQPRGFQTVGAAVDNIDLARPWRAQGGITVRDARRSAAGKRGSRLLRSVELLFLMGGAATLMWCAWVLSQAYVVQWLARERLESMLPGETSSFEPSSVAVGTPLAELSIPRVGLSAVVFQGSDDHTLRLGLGHVETTPLPGVFGNVAIAGHRDSFFRPLENVQVGDDIVLDTFRGRLHYRVLWFRVVNRYDVSVIGPTGDAMLTLVTCYPFRFIGPAPDRFVVRSIRVENPAPVAPTMPRTSTAGAF